MGDQRQRGGSVRPDHLYIRAEANMGITLVWSRQYMYACTPHTSAHSHTHIDIYISCIYIFIIYITLYICICYS